MHPRPSNMCLRLHLSNSDNNQYFNSQPINILDSLSEFKKLTELRLYNVRDINLTPFQVQDKCRNLKRLTFESDHPISESVVLRLLDNNTNTNINFVASLRRLDLRLLYLSATYTRYLVDYFPKQLIYLRIDTLFQTLFEWIELVGMELASRFMKKVACIKNK
ncbi:hypothetical protein MFLAVUS_006918 [Mucor flavus]|uniref:F-box domain-containing protein n=1 Tax=Mucor flavus TaxID=439312 RepID=A0ABP9Z2U8_9FUNG